MSDLLAETKLVVRPTVSRAALVEKLKREVFAIDWNTPGGDRRYREGWNAHARELLKWLALDEASA